MSVAKRFNPAVAFFSRSVCLSASSVGGRDGQGACAKGAFRSCWSCARARVWAIGLRVGGIDREPGSTVLFEVVSLSILDGSFAWKRPRLELMRTSFSTPSLTIAPLPNDPRIRTLLSWIYPYTTGGVHCLPHPGYPPPPVSRFTSVGTRLSSGQSKRASQRVVSGHAKHTILEQREAFGFLRPLDP